MNSSPRSPVVPLNGGTTARGRCVSSGTRGSRTGCHASGPPLSRSIGRVGVPGVGHHSQSGVRVGAARRHKRGSRAAGDPPLLAGSPGSPAQARRLSLQQTLSPPHLEVLPPTNPRRTRRGASAGPWPGAGPPPPMRRAPPALRR